MSPRQTQSSGRDCSLVTWPRGNLGQQCCIGILRISSLLGFVATIYACRCKLVQLAYCRSCHHHDRVDDLLFCTRKRILRRACGPCPKAALLMPAVGHGIVTQFLGHVSEHEVDGKSYAPGPARGGLDMIVHIAKLLHVQRSHCLQTIS